MPELKRNFLQGKMNKDSDERLVSNGEYRDALNIEVNTSESSNVGAVQTLRGNKLPNEELKTVERGEQIGHFKDKVSSNATTIAVHEDVENEFVYNFISLASDYTNGLGVKSDAIVRHSFSNAGSSSYTEYVFTDVFEVALQLSSTASIDNDSTTILGFNSSDLSEYEDEFGTTLTYVTGVRPGMKVDILDDNGISVLGSYEVRVVRSQNSGGGIPPYVVTTAFPSSGTLWASGYKLKFTSERLLNFQSPTSLPSAEGSYFVKVNAFNLDNIKINTINDFLFFTDGVNEPKKINVANSSRYTASFVKHTRLPRINKINKSVLGAFDAELSHITVIKPNPTNSLYINYTTDTIWSEEYGSLVSAVNGTSTGGAGVAFASSFNLTDSENNPLEPGDVFYLDPVNPTSYPEGSVIKIVGQTLGYVAFFIIDTAYSGGEGSYRCILQSVSDEDLTQVDTYNVEFVDKQYIYEDSFISFAYRYIYTDGEYSCISPYTNPMFVPSTYSYSAKDAFNLGMENRAKSIILKNFKPKHIPKDVVGVDLIFKETNSSNTFIFKTLYMGIDTELNAPGEGSNLGALKIDSKVFGTTMPSNQLTRIYDDVPKSAVAQEIVGNRLMLGNYKANYDINIQPNVVAWCQTAPFNFKLSSTSNNTFTAVSPNSNSSGNVGWSQMYPGVAQGTGDSIYNRVINFNEVSDNGNNFSSNKVYTAPAAGTYNFNAIIQGPVYETNENASYSRLRISLFECNADGTIKVDGSNIPTNRIASGPWRWSMRPNWQYNNTIPGSISYLFDNGANPLNQEIYSEIVQVYGHEFMVNNGWLGFDQAIYINPATTPYIGFVIETYGWAVAVNNASYADMQASNESIQVALLKEFPAGDLTTPELPDYGRFISVNQAPSTTNTLSTLTGTKSVKSERKYQVGIVYVDRFGRESTVLTSKSGEVDVLKQNSDSKNFIKLGITSRAPNFASHYKFFIKELAGKYHNMVLETAFDNNDDEGSFAWLVFNSADRNKIKVGDYLSLKKQYGSHDAVSSTDASWKVIDIQNEGTSTTTAEGVTEVSVGGTTIDSAIISNASELIGKFFVKVHKDADFNTYVLKNTTFAALDSGSGNNGAVFETKAKNEVDLDLYYEVTEAYPVRLDQSNAEQYIPVGSKIEFHDSTYDLGASPFSNHEVISVKGAFCFDGKKKDDSLCLVTLSDDVSAISFGLGSNDYYQVKFTREDGSFTTAFLGVQHTSGNVLKLVPYSHMPSSSSSSYAHHSSRGNKIMLPWFNCISFGNGVESDTIRDDFNESEFFPYLASGKQSGFKASLSLDSYREIEMKNEIIFSGILNDRNSINDTNQFLSAEKITKTLNPENGNIRALSAREGDLLAFCENNVVKILSQKDALYNADGDPQLISSSNVLGQAGVFAGEYGLTGSAGSLVKNEFRYYFCDVEKGSVLRLSRDGITVISDYGMSDWFSDNLKDAVEVIGSFDDKKSEYNLTIIKKAPAIQERTTVAYSMVVYTLSFNEKTNGWVSFKSFIKEKGISHKNSYYTFKNAKPYLHHIENGVNRNNFYGVDYNSTIDLIVNEDHSSIKNFKTINYEGSQSKITAFTTIQVDGVDYSDKEYYNLTAKPGWYVESIQTDQQQSGNIEFKEKEGKWFNSISGETTSFVNYDGISQSNAAGNLDFSEMSLQGLGVIQEYSDEGGIAAPGVVFIPATTSGSMGGWAFEEFIYQGSSLPATTDIPLYLDGDDVWFQDPFDWETITTSTNQYIDSISFTRDDWYQVTMTIHWDSNINTLIAGNLVTIDLPFSDGLFFDTNSYVNIPFEAAPITVPHVFDFEVFGNLKNNSGVYEVTTEVKDQLENLYSIYDSQYVDGINFNDRERFLCNYNIPISSSFVPIKTVTFTAASGRFLNLSDFSVIRSGSGSVSDLENFDSQVSQELYGKTTQYELTFYGAASIFTFLTYVVEDSTLGSFNVEVNGIGSEEFNVAFDTASLTIPTDATSGTVNFTSNYSGYDAYSVTASTNPGTGLTNVVLDDSTGTVSFTTTANNTASDITYVLDIVDADSNVLSSVTIIHSRLVLPNTVNLTGRYAVSTDSNTLNFDGDIEGFVQGDTNGDYRSITVQTNVEANAPVASSFKLSDGSALPSWVQINSITLTDSDDFWSYYDVDVSVTTPHLSTTTRTAVVKCMHSDGTTSSTNNITINQYRTYDSTITNSGLGLSVDDIVITDSEGTPLTVNNVGAIGGLPDSSLNPGTTFPVPPLTQSNFTNPGSQVSADGGVVSFYIKKIGGAEGLYTQQEANVCGVARLSRTEYNALFTASANTNYDTVSSDIISQNNFLQLNADGTPQTFTGSIANGSPTLYKANIQVNPMPSNEFTSDAFGVPVLGLSSCLLDRSILARFLFGNGLHQGSNIPLLDTIQYNASIPITQKAPVDCTFNFSSFNTSTDVFTPSVNQDSMNGYGGAYKTNGFTGVGNNPVVASEGPFTAHFIDISRNAFRFLLKFNLSPRLRSKIKYICWYNPLGTGADNNYSTDKIFVDYSTYSSNTCPGVQGTNASYGPSWIEIPDGTISSTLPYNVNESAIDADSGNVTLGVQATTNTTLLTRKVRIGVFLEGNTTALTTNDYANIIPDSEIEIIQQAV